MMGIAVDRKRPFAVRGMALAGVVALSLTGSAQAQFFGSPTYRRDIETRGPTHGHSGFVRFGNRQLYCDYIRVPNRQCTSDRSGRERCRVASWTLQQRCY